MPLSRVATGGTHMVDELDGRGRGGVLAEANVNPAGPGRTRCFVHDVWDNATSSVSGYSAPAGTDPGSGSWTASGSSSYSYNADGSSTAVPGATLSYNSLGEQSGLTITSGANSGTAQQDVYDADGSLLVQSDPVSGTIVYLGDTELRVAAGSSTVTGTRTYTLNDQAVAERDTTAGVSGSALFLLAANPQGTATAEIADASNTVTRRYFDPFGNPRGAPVGWTSNYGFLNKPTDPLTSSMQDALTTLGARTYDPSIGRFLSVDPQLSTNDPASVNGYAYASNEPVSSSDPSGLRTVGEGGSDDCAPYCGPIFGGTKAPPGASGGPPPPGGGGGSGCGSSTACEHDASSGSGVRGSGATRISPHISIANNDPNKRELIRDFNH